MLPMLCTDNLPAPRKNRHMLHLYLSEETWRLTPLPSREHADFIIDLRKRALNDCCGLWKSEEIGSAIGEEGEREIRWVEKTVLTGKVAGEEEHHGEDDQERDVRLQDSCVGGGSRGKKRNNWWERKMGKKQRKMGKGETQVQERRWNQNQKVK